MEVASRKKQLEQRYRESVEEVRRCEERLQRCASDAASGVDAVRACEERINSARSELNSVAFDAAAFDRLETRVRDEQKCATLRRAVEVVKGLERRVREVKEEYERAKREAMEKKEARRQSEELQGLEACRVC